MVNHWHLYLKLTNGLINGEVFSESVPSIVKNIKHSAKNKVLLNSPLLESFHLYPSPSSTIRRNYQSKKYKKLLHNIYILIPFKSPMLILIHSLEKTQVSLKYYYSPINPKEPL